MDGKLNRLESAVEGTICYLMGDRTTLLIFLVRKYFFCLVLGGKFITIQVKSDVSEVWLFVPKGAVACLII